ncbi:carbohydrate binding domain-containing protein [Opitutus terrae]|uniref:carbohydrate binding domain-containing protein n=1 Tax=Opitutus terrae TaxID=107709 RepID=UPI0013051322|nr:carbohydrate binding domain-containing protein [Opitutus terrae]
MIAASALLCAAGAALGSARVAPPGNLLRPFSTEPKTLPAWPVYNQLTPELRAAIARADGWHLVLGEGGQAELTTVRGEMRVQIADGGSIWWAVQVSFLPLPLATGKTYEVRFKARADRPQLLTLDIAQVGTWYSYAPRTDYPLTKQWQEFTTTFGMGKAASEPHARFEFNLGHCPPNVITFEAVSVTERVA